MSWDILFTTDLAWVIFGAVLAGLVRGFAGFGTAMIFLPVASQVVPLGVFLLSMMAPDAYRYAVSIIALLLLVALIMGLRYRGVLSKKLIYGTGAIGGFLAGSTGLAGPPVIMLYMASTHPAAVIRANLMLFLICADAMMLAVFALTGFLSLNPVIMGLIVAVPYLLANVVGAAIFKPEYETAYRVAAYTIIAVSAVTGLPIWD